MKNLAETVVQRNALRAERLRLEAEYKARIDAIDYDIRLANERLLITELQLDESMILLAEHVIYVRGTYGPYGDDASQVRKAINEIANGCRESGYHHLRTEFFGCKDYDRWHHQGCDCSYGYSPRHGSIVFAVGLTEVLRTMLDGGTSLTTDEKDAAIYYLLNLKAIQDMKSEARRCPLGMER